MSEFTTGNAPGFQAAIEAQESEVLWSGRKGQDLVATKKITLASTTADSGNSPTTTVRGGNVLAIVDVSGKANTSRPTPTTGGKSPSAFWSTTRTCWWPAWQTTASHRCWCTAWCATASL